MHHPITLEDGLLVQNWLKTRYLRDPVPEVHPTFQPFLDSDPYQLRRDYVRFVYERFEALAEYLIVLEVDVSTMLKVCELMGWVEVIPVILGENECGIYDKGIQDLNLGPGRHRVLRILSRVLESLPKEKPAVHNKQPPPGTKIALAIAVMKSNPLLTDKAVAEAVDCNPSTLSKSRDYKAARDAIVFDGIKRLRRSRRNRGGDMDNYSADLNE